MSKKLNFPHRFATRETSKRPIKIIETWKKSQAHSETADSKQESSSSDFDLTSGSSITDSSYHPSNTVSNAPSATETTTQGLFTSSGKETLVTTTDTEVIASAITNTRDSNAELKNVSQDEPEEIDTPDVDEIEPDDILSSNSRVRTTRRSKTTPHKKTSYLESGSKQHRNRQQLSSDVSDVNDEEPDGISGSGSGFTTRRSRTTPSNHGNKISTHLESGSKQHGKKQKVSSGVSDTNEESDGISGSSSGFRTTKTSKTKPGSKTSYLESGSKQHGKKGGVSADASHEKEEEEETDATSGLCSGFRMSRRSRTTPGSKLQGKQGRGSSNSSDVNEHDSNDLISIRSSADSSVVPSSSSRSEQSRALFDSEDVAAQHESPRQHQHSPLEQTSATKSCLKSIPEDESMDHDNGSAPVATEPATSSGFSNISPNKSIASIHYHPQQSPLPAMVLSVCLDRHEVQEYRRMTSPKNAINDVNVGSKKKHRADVSDNGSERSTTSSKRNKKRKSRLDVVEMRGRSQGLDSEQQSTEDQEHCEAGTLSAQTSERKTSKEISIPTLRSSGKQKTHLKRVDRPSSETMDHNIGSHSPSKISKEIDTCSFKPGSLSRNTSKGKQTSRRTILDFISKTANNSKDVHQAQSSERAEHSNDSNVQTPEPVTTSDQNQKKGTSMSRNEGDVSMSDSSKSSSPPGSRSSSPVRSRRREASAGKPEQTPTLPSSSKQSKSRRATSTKTSSTHNETSVKTSSASTLLSQHGSNDDQLDSHGRPNLKRTKQKLYEQTGLSEEEEAFNDTAEESLSESRDGFEDQVAHTKQATLTQSLWKGRTISVFKKSTTAPAPSTPTAGGTPGLLVSTSPTPAKKKKRVPVRKPVRKPVRSRTGNKGSESEDENYGRGSQSRSVSVWSPSDQPRQGKAILDLDIVLNCLNVVTRRLCYEADTRLHEKVLQKAATFVEKEIHKSICQVQQLKSSQSRTRKNLTNIKNLRADLQEAQKKKMKLKAVLRKLQKKSGIDGELIALNNWLQDYDKLTVAWDKLPASQSHTQNYQWFGESSEEVKANC